MLIEILSLQADQFRRECGLNLRPLSYRSDPSKRYDA